MTKKMTNFELTSVGEVVFTKEDVVNIYVSEFENRKILEKKEHSRKASELQEEKNKLLDKINKKVIDIFNKKYMPKWKEASDMFNSLSGEEHRVKVNQVTFCEKELRASFSLYKCNEGVCKLYRAYSMKTPSSIKKLIKKVDELAEAYKKENEATYEAGRALQSLDTIERSARAAVAKHALENTGDGRYLLENLKKTKALPGM